MMKMLWKAGHWPTLLSAFLYFDVSFMVWVLLGALGNFVAVEFQMGPAQKGLMTAIPLLSGAFLRLLFGWLTDTVGPRKTGLMGIAVTLLPLLLGWLWADSIAKVYLIGLLLGVAGASFAVALPLASRWYPSKYQGMIMGIAGAGNSGTVLSTLFAPRLAEAYGWSTVFGIAVVPLLAMATVFFFCAREAPRTRTERRVGAFAATLKQKDTACFSLFYGVTFGGFVGLACFLSIFLRDQYGVSKVMAGDLTSLCVVAGSFLRPVGGLLADRFGGLRMLMVLYATIAALTLMVAQLPGLPLAITFLVLLMAALGVGNGCVFQLVPLRYGNNVGNATGILGAAGGLGGFFLPTLIGLLKQLTGSFSGGLVTFAVISLGAFLTLILAQRRWVGDWVGHHGRVLSAEAGPAAGTSTVQRVRAVESPNA